MTIKIFSPQNHQIFQRNDFNKSNVIFSGFVSNEINEIIIEVSDKENEQCLTSVTIDIMQDKSFFSSVEIPSGGWYCANVCMVKDGQKILVDSRVFAVGEVFLAAGQSNSTNYGEERSQQTSGMVACFAHNHWELARDPLPGAHDVSEGGSPWLFFGDYLYEKLGVPIGIAITGHGGTQVKEWLPDDEFCGQCEEKRGLFNWMMLRLQQLGVRGCRAVLWHQGESDAGNGTAKELYYERLRNIITTCREQCGWYIPWFVALVSYRSPDSCLHISVREAQKKICDDAIAFLGPDTDSLVDENRDLQGAGVHFSLKGLENHGQMWGTKIEKWLKNHKI
ncbi:sialate O-acetylesterase [Candidatus Uabimicrobium amorphum]|uniref:Sialate O-acetylesterase domain-containing protein n=1 Tax=Uabimicrobium amorphum TaxID=2596890 RepID=A0A5S9IL48_UABAM|nr:sialate O-acetylesterase [Candidatus Uabimicrobium amorphum]BBM83714.1 hypothetical protein UABAM_02067 [Candidatus Uabimicrobium amorphum]